MDRKGLLKMFGLEGSAAGADIPQRSVLLTLFGWRQRNEIINPWNKNPEERTTVWELFRHGNPIILAGLVPQEEAAMHDPGNHALVYRAMPKAYRNPQPFDRLQYVRGFREPDWHCEDFAFIRNQQEKRA